MELMKAVEIVEHLRTYTPQLSDEQIMALEMVMSAATSWQMELDMES